MSLNIYAALATPEVAFFDISVLCLISTLVPTMFSYSMSQHFHMYHHI